MVVLIEDNEPLAQALELLLSPAEVVIAADMRAAEHIVARSGGTDTILVDLRLPDSEPLQTLYRIAEWKQRANAPRVIIITGTVEPEIITAAERSAADAVALKSDERGFFERLRDLGLITKRRPKGACANNATVERIEREVQGLTSGRPVPQEIAFRLMPAFRLQKNEPPEL
jgi:CheY-like chemotaxis protein